MRLAGRYEHFRSAGPARLHDASTFSFADIPELELQMRWFAGEFGVNFKTTAGAKVRVVQFGVWNREAGPDFAEAVVAFNDDAPVRGGIEIDPEARDWERHGHATNRAYESVVLHVFTRRGEADFFTRTAAHRNVPQVLLDINPASALPRSAPALAKLGMCSAPLRTLAHEQIDEILAAAAQFRLQKKAASLRHGIEAHGLDEALYQSLAGTLGYKGNKLPFTLLAQRLPLHFLRQNKADAAALLFGTSGFLAERDWSRFDQPTRHYLKTLWDRWWPRRSEFEPISLKKSDWQLSGTRPVNHPQRRLAALAQLVQQWPRVRALAESCHVSETQRFFTAVRDEYWDFHYSLTSPATAQRMALIGASRVTEMLANTFFPLAISRDPARWDDYRRLPAALSNQRVEIAAARLFAGERRELRKTVAQQQGLLQIYEDFCRRDHSDCAHCRFPQQLAQWS